MGTLLAFRPLLRLYPCSMDAEQLLTRITSTPSVLGGKPTVRGRRLAVEHVLSMLAAGDSIDDIVAAYDWLEREDVLACLAFATKLVSNERVELRAEHAAH